MGRIEPYDPRRRGEPYSEAIVYRGAPTVPSQVIADYDEPVDGGGDFQFWELVKALSRRRWLILGVLLLGVAASTALTLRVTPKYQASATIEVRREDPQIIEGVNFEPTAGADAEHMATQYALLTSRSLAERVAEVADLPSDERYADQSASRSQRLRQATNTVLANLSVAPVARSRIIEVTYVSPHSGEAARIANAVADNFIEANLERKYNATAYARRFLEQRLQTTKTALETSERRLVEYAREKDIFDLSGAGGSEVGASLDASSLIALNGSLAQAQDQRIAAEQRYREASRNTNTIPEMLSSAPVQQLRARRAELVAEYEENLGTFKPEFPAMRELAARIDAIDRELETERANIVTALEAEFRAAVAREASLEERVEELKAELQSLRDRSIEYTIISREVDTNRAQYEALLQRQKEVSIASGVGSSRVSIVDRAVAPTVPFEPNHRRMLLRAVALSLALAIGLALALEYIDDTIKTPEDVKKKLGLPAIGVVPKIKTKDPVAELLQDPKSPISEAFSSARTALQFATSDGPPRSLLLTGTRPAEGKTSSTVALSMAFAAIGKRVLIIDADMRKPSFVADAGASAGLSGLLTRDLDLGEHIVFGSTRNLFLLPSGIVPPNPAELLASPRLRHIIQTAEEAFDLVIVDSSPVLGFADAPLLSSVCDATLLVLQAGAIRRPAARRAIGRLMEARANLVGVLLTKFNAAHAGYGYGYGVGYGRYGKYAYQYSERNISSEARARRKVRLFADGQAGRDQEAGSS